MAGVRRLRRSWQRGRRLQLAAVEVLHQRLGEQAELTALRFFCEVTLGHPELAAKTSHVRAERTLPVILSVEEVTRLLDSAPGLKYQAALSVAYGAGLRAAEVVALKVGDIDSERMAIRVEQGKGAGTATRCCRRPCSHCCGPGGARPRRGAGCCPGGGCSRGRTRSIRCRPASSIAPAIVRRRTPGSPSASRCIPCVIIRGAE